MPKDKSTKRAAKKVAKIADYRKTVATAAQDKVVCLSVEFKTYGVSRTLDLSKVETEADKTRITASKHIMESDNIAAIKSIWGRGESWLKTKVLPGPLRQGIHLCPIEMVDEVERTLRQFEQDAQPWIKKLAAELPELKKADRIAFGNQFNEREYPTEEQVTAAFFIRIVPFDFTVSDKLPPTLYAREVAKNKKAWEETTDEARELLRETGLYYIQQMVKQLDTDKNGKRRPVVEATVRNLKQFVKDFPARNIADDDRMLYLVTKAKGLLEGVDAYDLRVDEKLRSKVSDELDKINSEVAGLMERPVRAIELEG